MKQTYEKEKPQPDGNADICLKKLKVITGVYRVITKDYKNAISNF